MLYNFVIQAHLSFLLAVVLNEYELLSPRFSTQIAPRQVVSRHCMLSRLRCGQTRPDVVQDIYGVLISFVEVVTNSDK